MILSAKFDVGQRVYRTVWDAETGRWVVEQTPKVVEQIHVEHNGSAHVDYRLQGIKIEIPEVNLASSEDAASGLCATRNGSTERRYSKKKRRSRVIRKKRVAVAVPSG